LQELVRNEPKFTTHLTDLEAALASHSGVKIAQAYDQFPKIAVEYAVMEKTPRVIVVTGDYGWSDVGNWAAVHDILGIQGDHSENGHHVHVGSKNNFIYNTTPKAVSLVGMKDTIVVVTDDAVLVTRKKDAHLVKEVVKRLEEEGKGSYL
jgi:mannose-1-phosphate guanylyltransferase